MRTVEHAALLDLAPHVFHDALAQGDESVLVGGVRLVHDLSDAVVAVGRAHASCGAITRFPSSSSANATPTKLAGRRRNGAKWLIGVQASRRSGRSFDSIRTQRRPRGSCKTKRTGKRNHSAFAIFSTRYRTLRTMIVG